MQDEIDKALAESSSENTSSSESSSESSSTSSSENEFTSDTNNNSKKSDQLDDELSDGTEEFVPRTVNELIDIEIPKLPTDFELNEQTVLESIGTLKTAGDRGVVIESKASGRYRVLDDGAIFVLKSPLKPIGVLFETFGPVDHPFHVVKFKTNEEAREFKEFVGYDVYHVVSKSRYVLTDEFRVKGSDASNLNDEEVPLEEQEFSDDEQEMLAKSANKKKKRRRNRNKKPDQLNSNVPDTRSQQNAPQPVSTLQMSQQVPVQMPQQFPQQSFMPGQQMMYVPFMYPFPYYYGQQPTQTTQTQHPQQTYVPPPPPPPPHEQQSDQSQNFNFNQPRPY